MKQKRSGLELLYISFDKKVQLLKSFSKKHPVLGLPVALIIIPFFMIIAVPIVFRHLITGQVNGASEEADELDC